MSHELLTADYPECHRRNLYLAKGSRGLASRGEGL